MSSSSSSTQTVNTTVPSTANGITYLPSDAWDPVAANNATDGQGEFLLGDQLNGLSNAYITYTFTQPATGFQYWAWQRSNGGLFSICFDCPPTSTLGDRIDALNSSTNGTEPPRLLYAKYDLSYAIHNVTIANLYDSRATIFNSTNGGYGQMSLDRFVLITPANPPTTSSAVPSSTPPPTAASGSATPSSSASTAPAGSGGSSSSSSSNTGAIAGGVVGGVVGLALIALLLWFLFFRHRRAGNGHIQDLNAEHGTAGADGFEPKDGVGLEGNPAAPFILSGQAPQVGYQNQPQMVQANVNHAYWPAAASSTSGPSTSDPSEYGARPLPTAPGVGIAAAAAPRPIKGARDPTAAPVTRADHLPTSPSVYPASSDVSGPTITTTSGYNTVTPRREEDAGFLAGDGVDDELGDGLEGTLPPDYDAATARRRVGGAL